MKKYKIVAGAIAFSVCLGMINAGESKKEFNTGVEDNKIEHSKQKFYNNISEGEPVAMGDIETEMMTWEAAKHRGYTRIKEKKRTKTYIQNVAIIRAISTRYDTVIKQDIEVDLSNGVPDTLDSSTYYPSYWQKKDTRQFWKEIEKNLYGVEGNKAGERWLSQPEGYDKREMVCDIEGRYRNIISNGGGEEMASYFKRGVERGSNNTYKWRGY